mmetsp:Transcript_28485/g.68523  ORF Transcript_28485/g.68523 Transcript_28485/m.68523 type:complete len:85 (-) Transcript_28485:184-438(-)
MRTAVPDKVPNVPAKAKAKQAKRAEAKSGVPRKSPRLRPAERPRRVSWGVVETRRFRASKPVANKPLPSSAAAKAALRAARKQK